MYLIVNNNQARVMLLTVGDVRRHLKWSGARSDASRWNNFHLLDSLLRRLRLHVRHCFPDPPKKSAASCYVGASCREVALSQLWQRTALWTAI